MCKIAFRKTAAMAALLVVMAAPMAHADSFEEKDGVNCFLSDATRTAEAVGTTRTSGHVGIASTVSIEVPDPQVPQKKITKTYTVTRVSGFMGKGISSVSIPGTVTHIARTAFQSCSELKSVNLPAALSELGASAFSGCTSLGEVSIPAGCIVGSYAFSGCTSLTTASSVGVDSIGSSAFMGCSSLTQGISLPRKSGAGIYSQCTSLKSKPITEHGIPDRTFEGCTSLQVSEIRMLDGAKIGAGAFSGCKAITEIYIDGAPVGVGAFDACSSLTKVVLGERVSRVGEAAFHGCPLKAVVCYASVPPVAYNEGIAASAFSSLHYSSATLYVPANWMSVYAVTQPWKNFFTIKALTAGIDAPRADAPQVVAGKGRVMVAGIDDAEMVEVLDMGGRPVARATAASLSHRTLPSGPYLVRCRALTAKVVL